MNKAEADAYFTELVTKRGVAEKDALVMTTEQMRFEYKADIEERIEQNKLRQTADAEMFKAVIEFGRNANKATFVMNGAAALGLLTLAGHISTQPLSKISISQLVSPLNWFVFGIIFSAGCTGCSYFSQRQYRRNGWEQWAVQDRGEDLQAGQPHKETENCWAQLAIACSVMSGICFAAGCLFALAVLDN